MLQLNRSTLIFFPPQGAFELPHVAQVWVKTETRDASEEEQHAFTRAQQDIEKVVESLIVGHAVLPLPKKVIIEGKGFTLTATRVRWDFADDLEFKWGQIKVQKMHDKWWFVFKVDNSGEP
ncbi:hypothetical protein BDZ89DRAFT_1114726 [Hymenopellis radicata]|nr:hypothetical protein BDZ89DRAFT_1114726 [Hymenopellis radicata]